MSTSSELGKNVRGLQRRGCYPMNLWRGWMRGGLGGLVEGRRDFVLDSGRRYRDLSRTELTLL